VRAVAAESATLRRTATAELCVAAAEAAGADADGRSVYTLSGGNGSVVGLDAAKRYETTVLVLRAESVSVRVGEVNLLDGSWRLDENAESLAYGRVESLEYADGAVVVSLTDGGRRTYPSDDRPTAALAALDDRRMDAAST
jgi:hypothetical protein